MTSLWESKWAFAAFIISHRRAKTLITDKTLRQHGYTGPIYVVVDTEDDQIEEYRGRFGEALVVFNKSDYDLDLGDNTGDRRTGMFARRACFDIARRLGYRYFVILDDDYVTFSYRYDSNFRYIGRLVKNLDAIFDAFLEYYSSVPSIVTLCMAQGGDFLGGRKAWGVIYAKRKAMNVYFCDVERVFEQVGRMNDDVNTYVVNGRKGDLYLTCMQVYVRQLRTQAMPGGLTEMYLDYGTYVKSFFSVMYAPSCVYVRVMGQRYPRLHHHVTWNLAVPCIVPEDVRRVGEGGDVARVSV